MQPLIRHPIGAGRVAHLAHSTRADGDLSPSAVAAGELRDRRAALAAHPWRVLLQVHSDRVITADAPSLARPHADALVTKQPGLVLAVHSGDCVPVGFISHAGAVAAAHAGWKGLEAGVLESTVRQLRALDADAPIVAAVGPHIHAPCYEFRASDLDRLAARFGEQVRGTTSHGTPALDLTAGIKSELERLAVTVEHWSPDCTACADDRYWSHRARQESGRVALVAWLEDAS